MALSQREKALVAIPILLGGLLGFYRWVHQPLLSNRAHAQELSDKTRADLKMQQAKLAREGDLKARLAAVTSREQTLDAWVPGKNSAALFIWYLSQAEARSGVKVKGLTVGERKEVQAVSQPSKPSGNPPSEPTARDTPASPPAPTPATPASPAAPAPGSSESGDTVTMLTVIQLSLKLDGRFAEHLLFSQELEGTPLFLNTDELELTSYGKLPLARVGKFLQDGNPWMAAQALQSSPTLTGNYQIMLYFKSNKVGPSTEPMKFAEPTGRPDPFVMDSVDEFLQALVDHFNAPPVDGSLNDPAADDLGNDRSQMG